MLKSFLALLTGLLLQGHVYAQSDGQEPVLKAAFIYNFTKYIEWDNNDEDNEFVIGVLGNSDVLSSLSEISRSSLVKNKKIKIKSFSKPEDISFCNILFISSNTAFSLQSVLSRITKGMLTIGEQSGYAKLGTAFNFVLVNEKLKFEANLKAIQSAGVKPSAQLLKLAIIVDQ